MVIIRLNGGLGNQLFQYAFGRALSMQHGTQLKFDIITPGSSTSSFTQRDFVLDKFKIQCQFATKDEIKNYKRFKGKYTSRFERYFVSRYPWINKKYHVQNIKNINNRPILISDDCYYDGYWQSEEYFKSAHEIIRSDLTLRDNISSTDEAMVQGISINDSVSIHIRRGDYLSIKANKKIYESCDMIYYNEAMSMVRSFLSRPVFYVFSDDLDWAKQKIFGKDIVFIPTNTVDPQIDLHLMSTCKYNIIANSTFSWWAAWLNAFPNKIVIAPKLWYKAECRYLEQGIIPKGWIRI